MFGKIQSIKFKIAVVLGLFFIVYFFWLVGSYKISFLAGISKPLSRIAAHSEKIFVNLINYSTNSGLLLEIDDLKEKMLKLESQVLFYELKYGSSDSGNFTNLNFPKMDAQIISVPPSQPFDSLLVDRGSKHGIKEGMPVFSPEGIFLGRIDQVFKKTSLVHLISYLSEEWQLYLNGSGHLVTSQGLGAGVFVIELPRDFPVEVGEQLIFYYSTSAYPAGFIEKVEEFEQSPVIRAFGSVSFNSNTLLNVIIAIENEE